jgi:hypothetical protein
VDALDRLRKDNREKLNGGLFVVATNVNEWQLGGSEFSLQHRNIFILYLKHVSFGDGN